MLNALIKWALNKRLLVIVIYVIVTIGGLYSLTKLPIDVLPDLNRPRVTVFVGIE